MAQPRLRPFLFYLKLLAVTIVLTVLGMMCLSAYRLAVGVTSPRNEPVCCQTPARFGAEYETIHFPTADGLKLAGWYIPPRNGAVIILLHAYYNDRRQTLPVAEMLYKHGYGILMYDQRATGESEGETRSLGWRDIPDLKAAVAWLAGQPETGKIGAYGCSIGAAISLAGSVGLPSIRAVATDAISPLGWQESLPPFSLQDPFSRPIMALYYPLVMLRAHAWPPGSTLEAVKNYGQRPLLFISTGQGGELARVSQYYAAAAGPKSNWNIPDSNHCAAPITHPQEYETHLVEFFNSALH
jgi:pimeloyl-ACP methyl ester carboxylesterase